MGLAQLLGQIGQSQKELIRPDGRVTAGNKPKLAAARHEFLHELFGPKYLGNEEFFRISWAAEDSRYRSPIVLTQRAPKKDGQIVGYKILPESTPILADRTTYGETDVYNAATFGTYTVGPMFSELGQERYKSGLVYASDNWLLVRTKEDAAVEVYRYAGAGNKYMYKQGRNNVFDCWLERGIGKRVLAQYWGAPLIDRTDPFCTSLESIVYEDLRIVYEDLSVKAVGIDELSEVDIANSSLDAFAKFYGGLAAHYAELASGYRQRIGDAEAQLSVLQSQADALKPGLARMQEQMRRLE